MHSSPSSARAKLLTLAVCLPVCFVFGLGLIHRLTLNEDRLHDLVQEWTSGRNYLDGKPVYRDLRESVSEYVSPLLAPTMRIKVNAHPPSSVLLTLPLANLDYPRAVLVWNLLSLAALACSVWLIVSRHGLGLSGWAWPPIAACLLVSSPLAHQVILAQMNLVILLLLTLTWWADRRGKGALGGALWGIAMALKLFPGFLAVYFIARRRWKTLITGLLTFAGLNAAAFLLFGGECFQTYVSEVMPQLREFYAAWTNASVVGFWHKLLHECNAGVVPLWHAPWLARALSGLSVLALAAAVAFKSWRSNGSPRRNDRAFALAVVGMVLASPIAWHHYFVILTLPLIVLWQSSTSTGASRFLLAPVILLLAINPWWIMDGVVPGDGELALWPQARSVAAPIHTLTVVSFQCYGLLMLFLLALLEGRGPTNPSRAAVATPSASREAALASSCDAVLARS